MEEAKTSNASAICRTWSCGTGKRLTVVRPFFHSNIIFPFHFSMGSFLFHFSMGSYKGYLAHMKPPPPSRATIGP